MASDVLKGPGQTLKVVHGVLYILGKAVRGMGKQGRPSSAAKREPSTAQESIDIRQQRNDGSSSSGGGCGPARHLPYQAGQEATAPKRQRYRWRRQGQHSTRYFPMGTPVKCIHGYIGC